MGGHFLLGLGERRALGEGNHVIQIIEDVAGREPALAGAERDLNVLDAGGGADGLRDVALVDPSADLGAADARTR